MKPRFSVCIPWRPSPSRLKPYECVRRYWAENFPGIPVITADSETEVFNLAMARNNAVRQARTDVVMLCDADTVVLPIDSVKIAVDDHTGVCWPADVWCLIPPEYADRSFEEFGDAPKLVSYPDGLGGCLVCTVEEYWRLGGHAENFSGWGYEDHAFHMVSETLSTFWRVGGTAFSIEHNRKLRQADSPGWNRARQDNRDKVRPYENANGKPELMRELLRIRYEPEVEQARDWRTRSGVYETDPVRRALFWTSPPKPSPRRSDWRTRA